MQLHNLCSLEFALGLETKLQTGGEEGIQLEKGDTC